MSGMEDYRAEVARYMARLYERGLTTACGGNVSLRAGDLMRNIQNTCRPRGGIGGQLWYTLWAPAAAPRT